MNWIVINIGCIECGVSSDIVGVYSDEGKAQEVAKLLNRNGSANWREGGQNNYEAFPLPDALKINECAPEYAEWLLAEKAQ